MNERYWRSAAAPREHNAAAAPTRIPFLTADQMRRRVDSLSASALYVAARHDDARRTEAAFASGYRSRPLT